LHVRVAVNLYQPLEQGWTLLVFGNSCWVSFKYEKLPFLCFRCGRIIHSPKGYSDQNSKKISHEEGWGLWLRAEDLSRGPELTEGQKEARSISPVRPEHV